MNIFFEPINLNQWNIFEKVEGVGHVEPFLATKQMRPGDLMLLHVGQQNSKYESGIYAIGEIISEYYTLRDHPEDYCNNKETVNVRIIEFNLSKPYITHEYCKTLVKQFRRVQKIQNICNDSVDSILKMFQDLSLIDQIEETLEKGGIKGEERLSYVKVRVNQSVFRRRLLIRYGKCCLCNIKNEEILRASHIKPWSVSSKEEKVDVDNGLLLCPNHDALFDRGLISFDENGTIVISEKLIDREHMNVHNDMRIELTEGNKRYMEYHRANMQ